MSEDSWPFESSHGGKHRGRKLRAVVFINFSFQADLIVRISLQQFFIDLIVEYVNKTEELLGSMMIILKRMTPLCRSPYANNKFSEVAYITEVEGKGKGRC